MEILLILVAIIAIACLPAFLSVIGAVLSGIFWTVAFVVIGLFELVGYSVEVSGASENPGIAAVAILALVVIIAVVKRIGFGNLVVAVLAVPVLGWLGLIYLAVAWGLALMEVAVWTMGSPDRHPEAVGVMIVVNMVLMAVFAGVRHLRGRKSIS